MSAQFKVRSGKHAPESIILPFELKNGNRGRSGTYHKSAAWRNKFEEDLKKLGLRFEPLPFRAIVHVTRIMKPRQAFWDPSSSGRGNYKELEDALVACGWFTDDSFKYIENVFFYQDNTRREEGPAIEIRIEEVSK